MFLDVVLVNSKDRHPSKKAEVLAQANLDGGGNTDEKRRARRPFPKMQERTAANEATEATAARQADGTGNAPVDDAGESQCQGRAE